jgi:hypothetical protein
MPTSSFEMGFNIWLSVQCSAKQHKKDNFLHKVAKMAKKRQKSFEMVFNIWLSVQFSAVQSNI